MKESHTRNEQMTAVGDIHVAEKLVEVSWSIITHDGAPALKWWEKSRVTPGMSAQDLSGRRTEVLNCH